MASDIESYISCSLALSSNVLDLSGKQLSKVPLAYDHLKNIEYLYLEGNALLEIPEQLFLHCRALRYLDLRNNKLAYLPPTIGRLKNLRTLLLSGNKLRRLPLEMGSLKRLSSLSLCDNNFEFPPSNVVKQGTKAVVEFLRKLLRERDQNSSSSEDDALVPAKQRPTLEALSPKHKSIVASTPVQESPKAVQKPKADRLLHSIPGLPLPVPQQACVHTEQPQTATERRINYSTRVPQPVSTPRSHSVAKDALRSSTNLSKKRVKRLSHNESPSTPRKAVSVHKAEIESALDKHKSQEYLSAWRQEAKAKQMHSRLDAARGKQGFYTRAAELAPFGTDLQNAPPQPSSTAREQLETMNYHRESVREFSKPGLLPNSLLRAKMTGSDVAKESVQSSDFEQNWEPEQVDPAKRAKEYRLQAFNPGASYTSPRRKKLE